MDPVGIYRCPRCGSAAVRKSRQQRVIDLLLLFILLRPVRCIGCSQRHYRLSLLPLPRLDE